MSDNYFLELFKEIGFTFCKDSNTGIGEVNEYKYYPNYLGDRHYTLIIFKYNSDIDALSGASFRLYKHKNEGGSFSESPFQIDTYSEYNINYLFKKINEVFYSELREIKLNKILNESSL